MSVQARPQDYAKAIYDLALEAWTRQLGDVQRVLNQDKALQDALQNTNLSVGERLERLDQATRHKLSDSVRKFLGTLLEAGQIDQLDRILTELDRLARRQVERKLAQVNSAVPLTPAEQEAMRARLRNRFGADLEFEFNVDPSLIGGVRVRVGDQILDSSVAGKLAALRDRLAA